jgi:hypothetical protein
MSDSCDAAFREALVALYREWERTDGGNRQSYEAFLAPIVRQMVSVGYTEGWKHAARHWHGDDEIEPLPALQKRAVEAALRVARGEM